MASHETVGSHWATVRGGEAAARAPAVVSHKRRAWLGVVTCAGFVGVAAWALRHGHPHEDAYILFCYVEQLVHEGRVAFYPGGPVAEGATDFLWMAGLAALHGAGVDVALAAALLSALAAGALSWLMARRLPAASSPWLLLPIPWMVIASQPAQASYGGFSALLFSTLSVACVAASSGPLRGGWRWVPGLALLLGLVRPEGVIVGGACVLNALASLRQPAQRRGLLARCLVVCALGVGYFAWRRWYFGHWLPLPVYVKALPSYGLPGLKANLRWLWSMTPWCAACVFALWARRRHRARYARGLWPAAALLLALCFVEPSQNHAFRFQGPASALLMWFAVDAVALLGARRLWLGVALGAALPLLQGHGLGHALSALRAPRYVDSFAPAWAAVLPEDTVLAVTEAGRLPYWSGLETHDLVGLNTPALALHPVDRSYLEALRPDVVMLHLAGTTRPARQRAAIVPTRGSELYAQLRPEVRSAPALAAVQRAARAGLDYLRVHDEEFAVFRVRYFGRPDHVYALRRSKLDVRRFEALIRAHHVPQEARGYWSLRRRGFAPRACLASHGTQYARDAAFRTSRSEKTL